MIIRKVRRKITLIKRLKRLFSFLTALTLLVGCLSVAAFAYGFSDAWKVGYDDDFNYDLWEDSHGAPGGWRSRSDQTVAGRSVWYYSYGVAGIPDIVVDKETGAMIRFYYRSEYLVWDAAGQCFRDEDPIFGPAAQAADAERRKAEAEKKKAQEEREKSLPEARIVQQDDPLTYYADDYDGYWIGREARVLDGREVICYWHAAAPCSYVDRATGASFVIDFAGTAEEDNERLCWDESIGNFRFRDWYATSEGDFQISGAWIAKYQGPGGAVVIPQRMVGISSEAFAQMSGVTGVTMPDTVTQIRDKAFYKCYDLTQITLPSTITELGTQAFANCPKLTAIQISNNPEYASVDGVLFSKDMTTLICCPGGKTGSYTIPDSVTHIADYAFEGCVNLTGITIPNSVTEIGKYAFTGCSSLTQMTVPDSVTNLGDNVFSACYRLSQVTLSRGITEVPGGAFYGCQSLTGVSLPDTVTALGTAAFQGCKSLVSITLPGSINRIGYSCFKDCPSLASITIPAGVVNINGHTFEGCTALVSVNLPAGVKLIDQNAFENCTALTSIRLPESLTTLSYDAFKGCAGLTAIQLPGSLSAMSGSAFEGCTALTEITIPASVTSELDLGAFNGCSALRSIQVDPANTAYASQDGMLFSKDMTTLIDCPEAKGGEIVIPQSVTTLRSAFNSCKAVTAVTVPSEVTEIPEAAFRYCSELTRVDLPDGLKRIGSNAFGNCPKLSQLTIPAGVSSIGETAFLIKGFFGSSYAVTLHVAEGSMAHQYARDNSVPFVADLPAVEQRPSDWAATEVLAAINKRLVPDALQSHYQQDITRAEFCQLVVLLREYYFRGSTKEFLGENPFTDTDDPNVIIAYGLGVVKGVSEHTFAPNGAITRQEAATMLMRTAKAIGVGPEDSDALTFADAGQFADWAVEGINYTSAIVVPKTTSRVMGGVGDNCFGPLGTYTREQAFISALRLANCCRPIPALPELMPTWSPV